MKRYSADDFWFELTEGPSPDGVGFVRYNRVTCYKCGNHMQVRNTGQANDQLRKFFLRQNWDIGRARNLHLCPNCSHKTREHAQKPQPHVVVPAQPRVTLMQVWNQAGDAERSEFFDHVARKAANAGEQIEFLGWFERKLFGTSVGTDYLRMLDKLDKLGNGKPIERSSEPEPVNDAADAPVAEWWQKIQERKSK